MGIFDSFKSMFGSKPKGPSAPGAAKGAKKKKLPRTDLNKRFELQGRTGQGSMSRVWRAYDRTLGRTVCLKILDKEKTAKFEARFVGKNKPPEGEICMELKHKNIVKTFEYGVSTKGEPYLVMELIEGSGLNFLVETRSPKLRGHEAEILAQLADAVAYLHLMKYMHRDLCPRNVMVTNDGVVKLIDFGLTIPYRPEFCTPGNRTGTPDYLPPEVIRRQSTDHRVDLFALGVTAFEVYTGFLPWERTQGSMEALQKHLQSPGKDPHEFRRDLSKSERAFLIKAVQRDVRERFQTAVDFRQAVLALVKDKE
ncbi:MAG: serine/threonine protein kinase [Gemmataceae bacterium]